MDRLAQLRQTLRANGQSLTTARRAVFTALQGQEPLTMHELVGRCKDIDRASVYRAVALYERLGVVQRLQTGWKYKIELVGTFHDHHHHATCLVCGQSLVMPEDSIVEHHLQRLAKEIGLQLERHQLELQGYCSDCQNLLAE